MIDECLDKSPWDLNKVVFGHTLYLCSSYKTLIDAIKFSKANQVLLLEKDPLPVEEYGPTNDIEIIKCSTLIAAEKYIGTKVAILNFANNHSIGGSPYSANAQEEQLCRKTTLYRCLEGMKESYYEAHISSYRKGELDDIGNDDLIYTPGVVVFKEDTNKQYLLEEKDWFKVDVITSAAPQRHRGQDIDIEVYHSRIAKILSIAKANNVETLILGAWGCGAFHNDPYIVAQAFKDMLKKYHFNKVVFAIIDRVDGPDSNYEIFKKVLLK